MVKKGYRGQSLVEFAFSIIVFMFVLVGVFDFGRLFWTKIVIANAARVGARYISNHPEDYVVGPPVSHPETINAAAADAVNAGITLTSAEVDVNCQPNGAGDMCESGYPATVIIIVDQELGILSIFEDSISLVESATMFVP